MLIGELMSKNIRQYVGEKSADGLDALLVQRKWREMLGPVMSRYSLDEQYDTASGKLTVHIQSSVLRNDLFIQRVELIKKLNALLNRNLVLAIVLR